MKKWILFACLLPLLCSGNADWKKYPYFPERALLSFPYDEGSHPDIPGLEWWYYVFHAKGKITGNRYAILVTHFNNQIRFFTVTNLDTNEHISGTSGGPLLANKGHLNLRHHTPYGIDFVQTKRDKLGRLVPFSYEMATHHDEMELKAEMKVLKRPLIIGDTGLVSIGESGHSWYYSFTRLQMEGHLSFKDREEPIVGIGWMDHQWGPFAVSPVQMGKTFESYEWFCLQLDNGVDIMISNIYDRDNNLPQTAGYGGIIINDANGKGQTLLNREFVRTRYWRDPVSGHYMSMGWSLFLPEQNGELHLSPELTNQMVHFPLGGSFWEGSIQVSGTWEGQKVTGQAFGELIHRFENPQLEFLPMPITFPEQHKLKVKWQLLNPDAGNPVHYKLEAIVADKVYLVKGKLHDTQWEFFPADFVPVGKDFQLRVSAYSVDEVISGHTLSPNLLLNREQ